VVVVGGVVVGAGLPLPWSTAVAKWSDHPKWSDPN
jgi:hypothetical protein